MKKVLKLYNQNGVPLFGTLRKDGTVYFAGLTRSIIENHFDFSTSDNSDFTENKSSPKDYSVCPKCGKRYYDGMTVSKIDEEDGCTKCMCKLHNPS